VPRSQVARRRLFALLGVLAVIAVVVGVLVASSAGAGPAMADDAAKLVPADALVYVNLSTDGDRDAVEHAAKLAGSFASYERLRDSILKRLAVGEGDEGSVRDWLGDEAALAFVAGQGGSAGSLVLLQVGDEGKAKDFVAAGAKQSGPARTYKGVTLSRYGAVYAAFVGKFLVLGQEATLHSAIDLEQGRGTSLSAVPTYRKLTDDLPEDRVADAYATADGLGRLLVPAGGAYGVAGVLLDRPGLKGVALSLSARDPGVHVTVESSVPDHKSAEFTPELLDSVPKGALAYYGTKGLSDSAGRLLAAAGTTSLGDLIAAGRKALGSAGAAEVQRDLVGLLRQETALVLLPGIPAPTLLLMARTTDEARTKAALGRLTDALPRLLPGAKVTKAGDVTTIKTDTAELDATVIDGKLVLSTGMAGIKAAQDAQGGLADADAFRATVGDPSKPVTSIVFLDFSQLLRLAEQTGLNDNRAYLAVKPDLSKVVAVGARSTGAGEDTTTEITAQVR
jgi:uncharacterized protein DUF3352